VVPFEDDAEWEAHHAGVMNALAPQGRLEEELAYRVALQLWRLQRVGRYERETLALLQADAAARVHGPRPARCPEAAELSVAQRDLRDARAALRLAAAFPRLAQDAEVSSRELWLLGCVFQRGAGDRDRPIMMADLDDGEPFDLFDIVPDQSRCPIRMLRDALPQLAGKLSLEELQKRAYVAAADWLREAAEEHTRAREAYEERRRAVEDERRRAESERREHILPDEHEREIVSRYETTLERSLFRTLGELRLLQAGRAGEPMVVVVQGDQNAGS
jgi:hypothetical protein